MTLDSALLTPVNIQNRYTVLMDDATLAVLIAEQQDAIEDIWGAASAARTELIQIDNPGDRFIKLRRRIASVASIYSSYGNASSHSDSRTTLLVADTDYTLHKKAGTVERVVGGYTNYAREPRAGSIPNYSQVFPYSPGGLGYLWGPSVEITWTPEDDTASRTAALYELVKLFVNASPMQSEQTRDYTYKFDPASLYTQQAAIINSMKRLLPKW